MGRKKQEDFEEDDDDLDLDLLEDELEDDEEDESAPKKKSKVKETKPVKKAKKVVEDDDEEDEPAPKKAKKVAQEETPVSLGASPNHPYGSVNVSIDIAHPKAASVFAAISKVLNS